MANTLRYEITEEQRREILHMLEWAQYAIEAHSRFPEVEQDLHDCGALWDALNDMQPVEVS